MSIVPPCIVLAGGLGTRLQSVVPDLPKCLAPVHGRSFLELQLRSLADRGVNYFILALGFRAGDVAKELASDWAQRYRIDVVTERRPLGTGGAIKNAMRFAAVKDAVVVNGDTYVGGQLDCMWATRNPLANNKTLMAVVKVTNRSRFGGVNIDARGKVCSFLEKTTTGPGLINAGIYRISLGTLERVKYDQFSLEELLLPCLASEGSLHSEEIQGPFIDIGTPDDYRIFSENLDSYVNET